MEYEKTIRDVGGSLGLILPLELCKYLGLEKGDIVIIKDENKKHGKFLSMWKKKEE